VFLVLAAAVVMPYVLELVPGRVGWAERILSVGVEMLAQVVRRHVLCAFERAGSRRSGCGVAARCELAALVARCDRHAEGCVFVLRASRIVDGCRRTWEDYSTAEVAAVVLVATALEAVESVMPEDMARLVSSDFSMHSSHRSMWKAEDLTNSFLVPMTTDGHHCHSVKEVV